MASPKELVQVVSRETGVPEATVIVHDRNLSLAGLRTVAGRGRAAAKMTYQDAANLIIAVAASRNVKDSAKTVKTYSPLPASEPLHFDDDGKEVVRGETFGDALAAFLEVVPAARDDFKDPAHAYVEVYIYGPKPEAKIEWKHGDRNGELLYGRRWEPGQKFDVPFADLQFISKFTQVTIGFVGEAVLAD